MFGRRGSRTSSRAQLDLFAREHARPARRGRASEAAAYNRADRDEAEERYGDYVDASRRELRSSPTCAITTPRTLDEQMPIAYLRGFNRAVAQRLPPFAARGREPSDARADRGLRAHRRPADGRARRPRRARSTGSAFPRFDSGACFAALLGGREHGRWLVAPAAGGAATARRYREDTLVLETDVGDADGSRPRDRLHAAARDDAGHRPDRRGRSTARVAMRTELVIRFDYGSVVPWVRRVDDADAARRRRPRRACCFARRSTSSREDMTHVADVRRARRATACRSSSPGSRRTTSHPTPVDPEQALDDTESVLAEWASGCGTQGEYAGRGAHARSLVLKALTYEPTGGIVAAPTTSLPERIGGVAQLGLPLLLAARRDAHALALLNAGFTRRGRAWRDWLLRAVAGDPCEGADPVRRRRGAAPPRARARRGCRLRRLDARCASGTRRTSSSSSTSTARSWTRSTRRASHGLRSRRPRVALAANAARVPRGRLGPARRGHLGGARAAPPLHALEGDGLGRVRPRGRRRRGASASTGRSTAGGGSREEIHAEVCREAVQTRAQLVHAVLRLGGARRERRSCIPLVGFLPADDPRVLGTIEPIQRRPDPRRLRRALPRPTDATSVDGLPGGEGVFLPCSFWLVDALLLRGARRRGARRCSSGCSAPQRPRPARGGVRPGERSGCSGTSRRRSRTSRSSTRRTTCRITTARTSRGRIEARCAGRSSPRLHLSSPTLARGDYARASSASSARCVGTDGRGSRPSSRSSSAPS